MSFRKVCRVLGIVVGCVAEVFSILGGLVHAETRVVPMIGVSERYDTNVLFINPKFAPDVQLEDFVTNVTPQLILRSREGLVDVNGVVGAVGEVYARNPGLNYVGFNGAVGLGLTPLLSRLIPRATLTVNGSGQYTPQPPAFLVGSPEVNDQNSFIRGIQAFRTNTTMYMVGQTFGYQVTPLTMLQATYSYSSLKFGSSAVTTPGSVLVDQQAHTAGLTPTYQLSARDALLLPYGFSQYEQTGFGSFRSHTQSLGWRRNWSKSLFTQGTVGAQFVESSEIIVGGQTTKQPSVLAPTARLLASYASNTKVMGEIAETAGQLTGLTQMGESLAPGGISSEGSYSVQLSYSYGLFPLFFESGGLMESHVFGLTGVVGLTAALSGTYGGNFAINRGVEIAQNFSYESISLNAGLNYLISPSLRASMNYSYMNSYGEGTFAEALTFNRQMVMVNLVYAFGGGMQFFQGASYFGPSLGGATGSPGGIPR